MSATSAKNIFSKSISVSTEKEVVNSLNQIKSSGSSYTETNSRFAHSA